jgi:hypothetical protein
LGERALEIDLLGTRYSLEAPDPRWTSLLRDLWHEFEVAPSSGATRIHIFEDAGRTWLELPPDEPFPFEDPWTLAEVMRYWLVERAVERAATVIPVHAAALTKGGIGALFAGPSGAGKTTLAVVLAQAGWALASDDIAPIDRVTGAVHPFPKPVNVRNEDLILPPPARSWPPRAGGPRLVAADTFARQRAPFEADFLFFISFDPDGAPALEPVSPGRAATDLIEYVRIGDAGTVSALARLCRRAPAWRLGYRNSDEAVTLVREALAKGQI